jgi:hypothetical protein
MLLARRVLHFFFRLYISREHHFICTGGFTFESHLGANSMCHAKNYALYVIKLCFQNHYSYCLVAATKKITKLNAIGIAQNA